MEGTQKGDYQMTFQTLIQRQPMRGATAAMLDAERALRTFNRNQAGTNRLRVGAWGHPAPVVQAVENEGEFKVTAELPGYAPEDVEVYVEDGVLSLKGVRYAADWSDELTEEEKDAKTDHFERRIRFNTDIDEEKVTAKCKNGLLEVVVPKAVEPKPEVRTIAVQAG